MKKIYFLLLLATAIVFASQIATVTGLDPNGDGFLSLRKKPKQREIGKLYNGDKVEILSQSGKYYKIKDVKSGMIGYAHSNWIRKSSRSTTASTSTSKKEINIKYLDALESKNISMVQKLLEQGADVDFRRSPGVETTPLYNASCNGNIDIVRILVKYKPALNNYLVNGTPLNCASYNGHKDVVKILLEAGADPLVKNKSGSTSFRLATNNKDIINLLSRFSKVNWSKYDVIEMDKRAYDVEKLFTSKNAIKNSDYEIQDIYGNVINISNTSDGLNIPQLSGKIVLLNLFSTSCPWCLKNINELNQLQEKYKEKIAIVSIQVDYLPEKLLKRFAYDREIRHIVVSNSYSKSFIEDIKKRANWTGGVPFLIFINDKGQVQSVHSGFSTKENLEEVIKKIK